LALANNKGLKRRRPKSIFETVTPKIVKTVQEGKTTPMSKNEQIEPIEVVEEEEKPKKSQMMGRNLVNSIY
jgi:hypothetical protein